MEEAVCLTSWLASSFPVLLAAVYIDDLIYFQLTGRSLSPSRDTMCGTSPPFYGSRSLI